MRHIIKKFDKNFNKVHKQILSMVLICQEQMNLILEVIAFNDEEKREQVRILERESDALEETVTKEITTFIARQQPMAGDLRVLLSSLHMARSLERIADNCRTLGRLGGHIKQEYDGKIPRKQLREMIEHLNNQLQLFYTAFEEETLDTLKEIAISDNDLDNMFESLFSSYLEYMIEHPDTIQLNTRLLFAGKNLERIGDHITHLAQNAYYAITGDNIQHILENQPQNKEM